MKIYMRALIHKKFRCRIKRAGILMSKIHILYLIDGMNIGGAEMLLRDVSTELAHRGYRISVGYSTPGPMENEFTRLAIPITRLPRLAALDPYLFMNILRLIRRDPPDILHTHLVKSDIHGRLAGRLAKVPVIISTLHNSDPWAQRWPIGTLYGLSSRLADKLVAVSAEVRDYHIAYSGIDPQKIQVIQNGVNIQRFQDRKKTGSAVRAEFKVDAGMVVYGIVGRFVPQKDHATFLRAAAKIHQQMPNARFLIIGDGPLRIELQTTAQQLGLSEVVNFTGFREDMPAVLAALDVMVFTSLWEGLPVTLLEGMASALPVIATAVDGINSVVLPEDSAYLIANGDFSSLAAKAITLGQNPELRQKMGKAGYERVLDQFSLEKMVNQTESLYSEMLQKHGYRDFVNPKDFQNAGETS